MFQYDFYICITCLLYIIVVGKEELYHKGKGYHAATSSRERQWSEGKVAGGIGGVASSERSKEVDG